MSENSWVIGDKELDDLLEKGKDQLGTKKYVDQLFNIISNLSDKELEKGFNIGLYGGWGSGKSSIVKTLEDKIEKDYNNEFIVVYFDCRKYSNDDLRRSILLEIAKKYNDSEIIEVLNKIIYTDRQNVKKLSGVDKDAIKFICSLLIENWSRKSFGTTFLVFSVLFGLLCWLLYPYYSMIEIIFSGTIITILGSILKGVGKIADYIKNFIPKMEVTHNIIDKKLFSGEQFEDIFRILIGIEVEELQQYKEIKEIVKKDGLFKDKKILFVFDNIDRCEPDTVKEILMTIKTFLNQDNCVFLLPIDYESVCESYEKYDQGDEYLRKIFNLGINLRQPYYSKLSDLVMDLMEKNLRKNKKGLNITDDEANTIAYMLASAFANNPRKIKQFLNQLGAEYILYKKEKPILSILKELIIRLEIPKLYKYLTEDQNIVFANEKLKGIMDGIIFLKNGNGEDYKFNEREQILLNKLRGIEEELMLLDDDNIKLEKTYNSPKDFIELIKRDKLENEACKFLRLSIESTKISGKRDQRQLLHNSIYYMSEYGIDKTLFNNIFKESNEFCNEDVIDVIGLIDTEVLYKFLRFAGEKGIKKLTKDFKIVFTKRFFREEPTENDINEFKRLDEIIQNLMIIDDSIINFYEQNFKKPEENRDIKESNYFKFLQSFPKYVNDNFIKYILKDVDIKSFNFGEVKSINIISLISLGQNFTEESLEKIYQLEELFFDGYQSLINDYLGNSNNAINSYLSCSTIIIKYGKGDGKHNKVMSNLVDLYNKYGINEFRDKVIEIFEIDFNRFSAYQWAYADIFINMNNNNKIIKLIEKTHNEGDTRRGLNNNQVENIIDKISREDDTWNNIIQSIRKNECIKDILFNRINGINDDTEKIYKIKQLDSLGILTEKDKELFGNELTIKLKTWLESGSIEDMEKVCDFIGEYHNSSIVKYIDYNYIYESLKSFDINIFKTQYHADVFDCYKGKKTKALRYLTNINKKFNNLNNKK